MMTFSYTERDMKKIRITQKFDDGIISLTQASEALGVSERTIYRYLDALRNEWSPWFIHGLKWKSSNHQSNNSKYAHIDKIIVLPKFLWFWPVFLAEKLEEIYGIIINKESLRQRMIKKKIWVPHKKKVIVARQKRERRPWVGMLSQFDWSYHERFENGIVRCLLCSVDDATSNVTCAKFTTWESIIEVFEFWKEYFIKYGKPQAIYLDCHSSYKVNHPKDQFDKEMKTRFQRAMEKLWIIVIYSKEPEWKWRVERWFATHQDRLIKEMRLANIKTREDANKFLENYYIPKHNKKFWVKPKEKWNYHTPITKEEIRELEWFFAKNTERTAQRDWTISYLKATYQLQKHQILQYWRKVIVQESIYWNIKILSWSQELIFKKLHKT